jgi:ARS binding protein 2
MDLATSGPPNMNHSLNKHHNPYHTPQSTTTPVSYPSPFRSHAADSSPPSHPMHPARPTHSANLSVSSQGYYSGESTVPRATPGQSASRPSSRGAPNHERVLPTRDVQDDQSFEDSYVQFILYCNPIIPSDVDTTDLRKNFSMPPRSDGKTFSTRLLFDLLKKFESKEIKTWTELALELGVEKPAVEKGQSSQKVQQYSVRLKVCSISNCLVSIFSMFFYYLRDVWCKFVYLIYITVSLCFSRCLLLFCISACLG